MARRTFFSFHYNPDVQRAWVVRQSQFVKEQGDTGLFDSSAFERSKNEDPDALKRFLRKEIVGSSVVCALVGAETAERRWVRFEIMQALADGRGLVGIRIHSIANFDKKVSIPGPNPFDLLGVYCKDRAVKLIQRTSLSDPWTYTRDFGQLELDTWPYSPQLPPEGSTPLSRYFQLHDWSSTGHSEIGAWLETAAVQTKR